MNAALYKFKKYYTCFISKKALNVVFFLEEIKKLSLLNKVCTDALYLKEYE